MMVIVAVTGPLTHSSEPTGWKKDCSVGPGVGLGLNTVQPAGTDDAKAVMGIKFSRFLAVGITVRVDNLKEVTEEVGWD
jgi:hypothetical protein